MVRIVDKIIDPVLVHDSKEKCDIDIIMPTYKDRKMSAMAAQSFFKFEKDLKIKLIFVDNSGKQYPFDLGKNQSRVVLISVPDRDFKVSGQSGKMSHSNAYALEIGRLFSHSKYTFVCHNDVLAYHKNWLSYLHGKMNKFKLAAFLRDNSRIKAAHVSGFLYNKEFFEKNKVSFWPADNPERDVGDTFSYYLDKQKMPYFVCPCSHNSPSLLKKIHQKYKELRTITADKCLDDDGNVLYIHTGRGTVKMLGRYKKPKRTNYKEWIKFAKRVIE